MNCVFYKCVFSQYIRGKYSTGTACFSSLNGHSFAHKPIPYESLAAKSCLISFMLISWRLRPILCFFFLVFVCEGVFARLLGIYFSRIRLYCGCYNNAIRVYLTWLLNNVLTCAKAGSDAGGGFSPGLRAVCWS